MSLDGVRSPVFEAAPDSGLGAQAIDVRLSAPLGDSGPIDLGLSILDQP